MILSSLARRSAPLVRPMCTKYSYERRGGSEGHSSFNAAFALIPLSAMVATTVLCEEHKDSNSKYVPNIQKDTKKPLSEMSLFTGNANRVLCEEIAEVLGIKVGDMTVGRYADGEVNVRIHENIRGKDIYIVQPTSPPTNENLVELLLMISTFRRSSARKITVVMPYYGYARQDRKMTARVPISAADVAKLIESMGVDRVIAVDLHCGQIQGFFSQRVPVDNLEGSVVALPYFHSKQLSNITVVSPDAGGVGRASKFRDGLQEMGLDVSLAMIIKQRKEAGSVDSMDLVGNVEGSDVIIVDDMIDTAGTLCKAAAELKERGAKRVFAVASHGLFSGPAVARIHASALEEVVVLNTVVLPPGARTEPKITQLSIAGLLAEAISRIHLRRSVSSLFAPKKSDSES